MNDWMGWALLAFGLMSLGLGGIVWHLARRVDRLEEQLEEIDWLVKTGRPSTIKRTRGL